MDPHERTTLHNSSGIVVVPQHIPSARTLGVTDVDPEYCVSSSGFYRS